MFVKFIEHETHAVHEAVHVRRLALVICGTSVVRKGFLEGLEIVHPFNSKIVPLDVGFVEDKNKWQFRFVQYTACVTRSGNFCEGTSVCTRGGRTCMRTAYLT